MKYTSQEIINARHILRESGYMVESLWSLPDVLDKYQTQDGNKVDEATAYEILKNAVTNPYIFEKIFEGIDIEAAEYNLKMKED